MRPLSAADPTAVASYRLLGVLGGGGMGRVYLAQSRTGRQLAVKVIRTELAEDPVFRRRFAREVAAARLVSPLFTAAVVDADTEADSPWLATTYIEGPSLEQWVVEHGPLSSRAVLMLAAGLAEALASIHRVGLVHRDLKPSNVLIDDAGPHIIDFGVALASGVTRMTASLVVGTPSYMAPERINGSEGGPPADVFSLGATLVFAATGQTLVNEDTMYAQVMQIMAGTFDLSKVPAELRPLTVRCLSQRPKDRPTADELARILVASGISAPSSGWHKTTEAAPSPVLAEPLPASRVSRRRVLAVGGVLGAAVVGVGGFGVVSGRFDRWSAGPATAPAPVGPRRPGDVLWQVRSGARPLGAVLGAQATGVRIIIDRGQRVITANGSEVAAVDTRGDRVWRRSMSTGLLNLQQWGDAVLVHDPRWLWLLDAGEGTERFARDVVTAEQAASRDDNPDSLAVELRGVALAADRGFLDLGTATVAIDRTGEQLWRTARPAPRDGRRPPPGSPHVANDEWLVTRDVVDSVARIGLVHAPTGQREWLVEHAHTPPSTQQPPPPGPGGGPGAGPPPHEDVWELAEGRLGERYIVLRDAQDLQVRQLSDGRRLWQKSSPTPIAGIELVDDTLLVAADSLTAYSISTGAPAWQVPLRGARIAVSVDGTGIIAATEQGIWELDRAGAIRWQAALPPSVRDATPDRLTAGETVAFLTFRPRGERPEPLDVDVLGIALDG